MQKKSVEKPRKNSVSSFLFSLFLFFDRVKKKKKKVKRLK
jgi:hypothetical protein